MMGISNRTFILAVLSLLLTGCEPATPSFVKNGNSLLEKQITTISNQKAQCKYTNNDHYWLSACSVSDANNAPVFALFEPEGVMQGTDNLAIFVTPLNDQARYFSRNDNFTIPVIQRKVPVDVEKTFDTLFNR